MFLLQVVVLSNRSGMLLTHLSRPQPKLRRKSLLIALSVGPPVCVAGEPGLFTRSRHALPAFAMGRARPDCVLRFFLLAVVRAVRAEVSH